MECNNIDWQINIDDAYSDVLLKYSKVIDIQCRLDTTKNEYSIVEKFVYDVAKFHLNRLNKDFDENTIVTFWINKKCNKCGPDFHIDKDDYEVRMYNTNFNLPFITLITYLNDSNSPTMFTNIDGTITDNKNYNENPKICFSFPRKMKHTCFNGKYIHTGIDLTSHCGNAPNLDERNLILIALWDKPPLHVPYYDESIFSYLNFMTNNIAITNEKYDKSKELVKFVEKNAGEIVIINDSIITYEFFEKIIEYYSFKTLNQIINMFNSYVFKIICSKSDTFIIDSFSNLSKYEKVINCVDYINSKSDTFDSLSKYGKDNTVNVNEPKCYPFMITDTVNSICPSLLKCDLKTWMISSSNDFCEENQHIDCLINECILAKNDSPAYLLNHSKFDFNLIEKYVYDIAQFHLKRLNIEFDKNICIEFWFKSRNVYGSTIHTDSDDYSVKTKKLSKKPFLSCLTYLDNNNDPTIITNIDNNAYKFKNLDDNTLCFSFPVKMKHIVFNGGKYYHCEGNVFDDTDKHERCLLIIDFWYNHVPKNLQYYDSKIHAIYNEKYNKYIKNDYLKNDDTLLYFNNENQNIKKIGLTDLFLNNNIFEEILYKKDSNVFKKFRDVFNGHDLYNNNTIILHKIEEKNAKESCKLEPMKFNTELFKNSYEIDDVTQKEVETDTTKQPCEQRPPIKLNNSLSKHVVGKFLEKNVCSLIIKEMNDYIDKNNNWDIINMNNENIFTINLDKLPKTLHYIIQNVFDLYSNSINEKYVKEKTLNFNDIFITKYNECSNYFNFHNSMTTITSYIFLNNTNIIMGACNDLDTNDELLITHEGDMIMHISDNTNNVIKHMDNVGYFLVFYIDLYD